MKQTYKVSLNGTFSIGGYPRWSARHEKYAIGSHAWILQLWWLTLTLIVGE